MRKVKSRVKSATELLTGLKLVGRSTWRYTPVDVRRTFYHLDDLQPFSPINIKCFWNLSDKPRIWNWGHLSNDLSKIHRESYRDWSKKNGNEQMGYNSYNRYLNSIIQNLERHRVEFGQYDLWITDSQKTAHQCILAIKLLFLTGIQIP